MQAIGFALIVLWECWTGAGGGPGQEVPDDSPTRGGQARIPKGGLGVPEAGVETPREQGVPDWELEEPELLKAKEQ